MVERRISKKKRELGKGQENGRNGARPRTGILSFLGEKDGSST